MGAPSRRASGSPPGILEHERGPAGLTHQFQRPNRPGTVQLVLQAIFVGKAVQAGRQWLFRGGPRQQVIAAGVVRAPSSVEDTLAVVPQDLQSVMHCREAFCRPFLRTQVSSEDMRDAAAAPSGHSMTEWRIRQYSRSPRDTSVVRDNVAYMTDPAPPDLHLKRAIVDRLAY
jgi:hypothetical protein